MNCTLCKILQENENIIWTGKYLFTQYDRLPISPGHCQIVPKRHIENVSELNAEEWQELKLAIPKTIEIIEHFDWKELYQNYLNNPYPGLTNWFVERALIHPRINTKPDAYNHGINDGRAAGRSIDHMHWHVIPRYEGDVLNPRGGIRHIIPGMGNY